MMKIKMLLMVAGILVVGNAAGMECLVPLSSETVSAEFEIMRETFKAQRCAGITTVEYNGNGAFQELVPGVSMFLGALHAKLLELKGRVDATRPAWLKKSKNIKLIVDMGLPSNAGLYVAMQMDRFGTVSVTLFQQFFAEHAGHQIDDWFDQFVGSLSSALQDADIDEEANSSMVVQIYNPMGDADGNMRSGQAAPNIVRGNGKMWHAQEVNLVP